MAEVIRMPKMSDTMEEGVIASWLKQVGEEISSGDILAEVETDKATMELENYEDGVLLHVGVKEKDTVPVDAVIAIVGEKGEDISALLKEIEGGGSAPRRKRRGCACWICFLYFLPLVTAWWVRKTQTHTAFVSRGLEFHSKACVRVCN